MVTPLFMAEYFQSDIHEIKSSLWLKDLPQIDDDALTLRFILLTRLWILLVV